VLVKNAAASLAACSALQPISSRRTWGRKAQQMGSSARTVAAQLAAASAVTRSTGAEEAMRDRCVWG